MHILWFITSTETVPSLRLHIQRMLEGKPLQDSMPKHIMTKKPNQSIRRKQYTKYDKKQRMQSTGMVSIRSFKFSSLRSAIVTKPDTSDSQLIGLPRVTIELICYLK